jgi:hypothetical protein
MFDSKLAVPLELLNGVPKLRATDRNLPRIMVRGAKILDEDQVSP